jgi:serine/threonine-protein kinase RsbW
MIAHRDSKLEETTWSTHDLRGRWACVSLRRSEEVVPVLDQVAQAMTERGYPPRDVAGLRLALEEAVVNALEHGNGGDPARQVMVRYAVGPQEVLVDVEDEGPGFDPDTVPDPTAPENLDKPGGRGLLLMRHFTSWVRFHGRGNRVTLCKRFPVREQVPLSPPS